MKYWKTYKQTIKAIIFMTLMFIGLFTCILTPKLQDFVKAMYFVSGCSCAFAFYKFGELLKTALFR